MNNGRKKTILITGNMGYVGSQVVKRLRQSFPESKLIGLDAGFFAHCLTASALLPETRVDIQYFMDIRDLEQEILTGVDGVIHLAALSNDAMGQMKDRITYDVNYRASIRLARLCKQKGVRSFVFASSCSVYGFSENGACTEASPVNPLTTYAKSKVMTESKLKELAGNDFKVTCLRFATACGMSERLRLDLVLNDLVHTAVRSGKIKVLSDGTPWRPLIHVSDMARAIDWALSRPPENGGIYLIVNAGANEANYQVQDLAYAIRENIPSVTVSINPAALPDKRSYRVCFDLFKKLAPQHQPQISLREAIRELIKALDALETSQIFRCNGFLVRLDVLSRLSELQYCNRAIRLKKNFV